MDCNPWLGGLYQTTDEEVIELLGAWTKLAGERTDVGWGLMLEAIRRFVLPLREKLEDIDQQTEAEEREAHLRAVAESGCPCKCPWCG